MNCSREHFFTLSSDELSAIIDNTESIVKLCGEAPILVKEKTACQQHELVQWKAWVPGKTDAVYHRGPAMALGLLCKTVSKNCERNEDDCPF